MIIDLMIKMGYGRGGVTQYSHDGGIDGIIDEDKLGLFKIYLQAKRYSDSRIHKKEMRDFMGAHTDEPLAKGAFITTSTFTDKTKRMAKDSKHHNIRLIGGGGTDPVTDGTQPWCVTKERI